MEIKKKVFVRVIEKNYSFIKLVYKLKKSFPLQFS